MDAINLILFAVLFVLQVAILILLLRRRSGDAGHQTELLARQLQAQDNERRAQIERLEAAVQTLREDNYRQQVKLLELVQNQSDGGRKTDWHPEHTAECLVPDGVPAAGERVQESGRNAKAVLRGNGKRQRVESGAYQCKEPRHLGGGAAGQYFRPDGAGYV